MAFGAAWKGHLKISLVSLPVRAISALATGGGKISFNQLHAECHSRIRYVKSCPIHGEVPASEIVSGYEYAKGKYVIVDPDEIDKLRTEADRSIDVTAFVKPEAVDALYYSGKSYYLLPDGKAGEKPYQLIRQAMVDKGVHAIAQVVLSKKDELVVLRPVDDLLTVTVLLYASQVKSPETFGPDLVKAHVSKQEIQLTNQLIDALTNKKFDIGEYHDQYTEKLRLLIEAKVEGREIVAPEKVREPEVINLMDALKKSLKRDTSTPTKKSSKRLPGIKAMRQASVARRNAGPKRKIS